MTNANGLAGAIEELLRESCQGMGKTPKPKKPSEAPYALSCRDVLMAADCIATLSRQLAEAQAVIERMRGALVEVDGCFEAAYVEGLAERLSELPDDVGGIKDLVNRRLLPAREAALAALNPTPPPPAGEAIKEAGEFRAGCPKCPDYVGKCPYCGSPRPRPAKNK